MLLGKDLTVRGTQRPLMVDLGVFMLYELLYIGDKMDSSYQNISIDYEMAITGIKTMFYMT